MFSSVKRAFWQLVSPTRGGGGGGGGASTSRKRARLDSSAAAGVASSALTTCDAEHTVVYLLLQGGHLSPQGLAALSCLNRTFRAACENEGLWHLAATSKWPSLNTDDIESTIRASGGYRRLFQQLHAKRGGDAQICVPQSQIASVLVDDITFYLDVAFRGQPVYSRRLEGAADLDRLQQAESCVFRLPDAEMGVVLVEGKPGLSRRALERCARELHVSVIALRKRDAKFCCLLDGKMNSSGAIGGSVYASLNSFFILPGIFQMTCVTVDSIVSVTSRVRETERRDDGAVAATAAAAAAGAAAPAAADGSAAAPATADGTAAAAAADANVVAAGVAAASAAQANAAGAATPVGPQAAGAAPQQPATTGEAAAAGAAGPPGGRQQPAAATVSGDANSATAGGPTIREPAGASRTARTAANQARNDAAGAAAAAATAVANLAQAAAAAGAAAAGAAAAAAGAAAAAAAAAVAGGGAAAAVVVEPVVLDVVLGGLSFQLKAKAVERDERKKLAADTKWVELRWK